MNKDIRRKFSLLNVIKNLHDYTYNYYNNKYFYKECENIYNQIINGTNKCISLKDDIGCCENYIFQKILNSSILSENIYVIISDLSDLNKIDALFIPKKLYIYNSDNNEKINLMPYYYDDNSYMNNMNILNYYISKSNCYE